MKRKAIAASVAAVALGLTGLGVGTYAWFVDTEVSANQSISAGTLDLIFNRDAATPDIAVTLAQPGDGGNVRYDYLNQGSVPGTLSFDIEQTADIDDGCTEPEGIDESSVANQCLLPGGELDDNLDITLSNGATSVTKTLTEWVAGDGEVFGTVLGGGVGELTISWSIDQGVNNIIQSDSASFKVHATLDQVQPA